MGLHASHVPLASARAHPTEVVVLSASALHWPSFRPEGRRALYLARWYGGGANAVGVHLWASSAEALTALASPFAEVNNVRRDVGGGSAMRSSEVASDNGDGGGNRGEETIREQSGAYDFKDTDSKDFDSSCKKPVAKRQDSECSPQKSSRPILSPSACLVAESHTAATDPLAAWIGDELDNRADDCAVIKPHPSLRAGANSFSDDPWTLVMPVAYWPLARPMNSEQLHGGDDLRVQDVLGRFPGRIYTLPCTTNDDCNSEEGQKHLSAENPGWRWVRPGSEIFLGDEEARVDEEVVWFGRRAGIFLPLTVSHDVI
jgi:hypothetical protein